MTTVSAGSAYQRRSNDFNTPSRLANKAGTKVEGGRILANGGRVLNVSATGKTVREAQARAYQAIGRIRWPEGFYRRDIGWRAVERERLR